MEPGSRCCRRTQNVFETVGEVNYLSISGTDHQVDHNTFQHKNVLGKFIGVRDEGSQIAERLWIHHNIIHSDYFGQCRPAVNIGNDGAEVVDGADVRSHNRPTQMLINSPRLS